MPGDGEKTDEHELVEGSIMRKEQVREHDAGGAFRRIQREHRQARTGPQHAQDIRSADILAPQRANIHLLPQQADPEAEGEGADQIAHQKTETKNGQQTISPNPA